MLIQTVHKLHRKSDKFTTFGGDFGSMAVVLLSLQCSAHFNNILHTIAPEVGDRSRDYCSQINAARKTKEYTDIWV